MPVHDDPTLVAAGLLSRWRQEVGKTQGEEQPDRRFETPNWCFKHDGSLLREAAAERPRTAADDCGCSSIIFIGTNLQNTRCKSRLQLDGCASLDTD
eukprot:283494-Prorocentrum_minimum.AAC.2